VLAYGIFLAQIIEREPAPTIFRDVDIIAPPTLITQGANVPCQIGTIFGVLFNVEGLTNEQIPYSLTIVWKFPTLRRPDGETSSETRRSWPYDGALSWGTKEISVGWKLEEPFELVSGTWKLEVFHAGHSILKQAFNVTCE